MGIFFGNSDRPRTILVRFHNYTDRDFFLRNSHKLKGTNIFVNKDLCQSSLNIRKEKLPLLQQARKAGKTAYFKHTTLIVRDKPNFQPASDLNLETTTFPSQRTVPQHISATNNSSAKFSVAKGVRDTTVVQTSTNSNLFSDKSAKVDKDVVRKSTRNKI